MMKRFIATWLLCLALLLPSLALATTVGPNAPAALFNDAGSGTLWVNPSNASSTNASFATYTTSTAGSMNSSLASNQYGFSIPGTATLNGISFAVLEKESVAGNYNDTGPTFCGNVSSICTARGNGSASTITTTLSTVTYGGPTDTWGGITVADVNDAASTLYLYADKVGGTSAVLSVDSITMTVYYTPAGSNVRHYASMTGVASSGTDAGNAGGAPTPDTNPPTGFAAHWDQAPMWFTAIAAGASPAYTNIHISGDPGTTGISASNSYGVDDNFDVTTNNSDPTHDIITIGTWGHRSNGSGNLVTGTHMPASFNKTNTGPPTLIELDDPFLNGSIGTPNNPTILYNSDMGGVIYMTGACRLSSTANIYAYTSPTGTHGGSQLSGGEITQAELTAGVIKHAVGITLDAAKYMTTTGHGTGNVTGAFAPALAVDSYFPSNYGGTDTTFGMGSRLAIPAATTCSSLGAGTGDALTLCTEAKTYGFIVVDDSGWDEFGIEGNVDANVSLYAIGSTKINAIFGALQHVRGVIPGD